MNDVQTALAFLDRLSDRGRQLQSALAADPRNGPALDAMRAWQADVAAAINELSGGSKAHWLSKAFSGAFLITTPQHADGALVVEAPAADIVRRLLEVLGQAHASLLRVADGTAAFEAPPPRRFEFVRDAAIRPILEQAYLDAERAVDTGEVETAFMTYCSILEAVITDALQADVSRLSFDQRIAAAESAGLIRGGCARLPPSARQYREHRNQAISIRDATVVRQVLRVVMRDLDPGR
jgi:hypothetical protein